MNEMECKEPQRKKMPPPVPKFRSQPVENAQINAAMQNFFAEIQQEVEPTQIVETAPSQQSVTTNQVQQSQTQQVQQQQQQPQQLPASKDLLHLNNKLSSILRVCKNSTKLTPIVNKPQEYDPSRPNDYEELKRQMNQSETQNEQPQPQQIEEETEPSYNEVELGSGEEKALKMMEKFGYKFGLGLGKYNQGIQNPIEVIKTSNSVGVIEVSSLDFTDLLPQNVVFRKTFEQHKQQPTNILVLLNAITAKDVDEYFKDEIKAELGKYGYIKKIHVHVRSELEEDIQVRVFIEYANNEEAMAAFLAADQRVFGGRIMTCRFYSIENFNDGLYDAEL
ncbi:unnamed protein product [Paramecium pentaurelia]|uniref:G-patch domain-containing protein n=1 Tax=Paramecium pentaurelia TaxID=43138 RepID=A0A8S1U9I5_9CILI|nr:unnamed protein product [Paramecium pentaurelia]